MDTQKHPVLPHGQSDTRHPVSAKSERSSLTEELYRGYLEALLAGERVVCRKLSLSRKPVKVATLVAGVRSMIDLVARAKGVIHEADLEEADLLLKVDEPKIGQVLINLTRNAIEYSTAGGRIRVSTRQEGNNLAFAVKDKAGGIPEKQCKQTFAPFERAKTLKTGGERSVGLGLAIAKKIVTAQGGILRVESEWGIGSTFSFTLPISTGTL